MSFAVRLFLFFRCLSRSLSLPSFCLPSFCLINTIHSLHCLRELLWQTRQTSLSRDEQEISSALLYIPSFKWQQNYPTMFVNSNSGSSVATPPNNGHINNEYSNDNPYLTSTYSHDHLCVPSFYGPHSRSTPNVAMYCDNDVRITLTYATIPLGYKVD
jgi:hypothetical protein